MWAQRFPVGRRLLSLGLAGLFLGTGLFAAPFSQEKPPNPSHDLIVYESPTGEKYCGLVLPAPAPAPLKAVAFDHILLIDTSASQAGNYRTRSAALVAAFCAALPPTDRVMLVAADVSTALLTEGFVAGQSAGLASGLEKLNDRVPLGSSDLEATLRSTLKSFAGDRSRSILYFGDGFSTVKLIQPLSMVSLIKDLRLAQVPVSSYAIGPVTDLILLGALAQHSGGNLHVAEGVANGEKPLTEIETGKLGVQLVHAARSIVFYPETIVTTPNIPELQPQLLPPVRFDRETVLLGKGFAGKKLTVRMSGQLSGKAHKLTWEIAAEESNTASAFVAQAWQAAARSSGMSMPYPGREWFIKYRKDFQTHVEELEDTAEIQLQRNKLDDADQIAQAVQSIDPNNVKARQLLMASHKLRVQTVLHKVNRQQAQADAAVAVEGAEEAPAAGTPAIVKPLSEPVDAQPNDQASPPPQPPIDINNLDTGDRSNPKDATLLEELTARQQVRIQEMTAEVNRATEAALRLTETDFESAASLLKNMMDVVDAAVEIPGSIRQPLERKLTNALLSIQNQHEIDAQKAASLRTRQSQAESRKKLLVQAERDEQRMEQLIERVRALITRGVKGEASAFEEAEEYGRIAVELDPYNYVPNMAVFNAEAFGALDQARRMRALRADKFLAALYEVERAHVPFPDEPPVLWPSAERWREITIKREKWKSVDLKNYSKQEEKIVSALNKPMKEKFDFIDATLEDVRNKLIEVYEINVIIDKAKLEEETIATDTADINLVISDIMLKNALKLLLEPKNLTYSIQDEVLKITTKTDGAGKKPIKAVYAGDLATPVNPLFGQGGGQVGGQQGGQQVGQQGGGFGGGGQGFGGGGGGGFGGGGGGGQGVFNIPPMKLQGKRPPALKE